MTSEQRQRTKQALRRYGMRSGRPSADREAWAEGIEQTLNYYEQARDPVRAGLLRLRYIEHRSVDETMERLHIGHTTYHKAQLDMLSTVALYASQRGAAL